MSAMATICTPLDASPAIELGNTWRKRVLPVGDISYQGRTLKFTKAYNDGLAAAFRDRAYDQVSFQLAPGDNSHTNDPERHRGVITDLVSEPDGLWMIMSPTERGEQVLRENPYLGVSARIVEQYKRSDGKFYPAAVQHVLGTLDPRIPGLGAWTPIEMSNGGDSALTIDLSGYSFTEPAPPGGDELTDQELEDLLEVLDETGAEGYGGELTDDELEMLMGDHGAAGQFEDTFQAQQAAAQAREQARQEFDALDLIRPARREEDVVARVMARAEAGLYGGQQADFSAQQAAIELAMTTGRGNCSAPDPYGRCSGRYHALGCSASQGTDWAAIEGGPPASTYQAALSNADDALAPLPGTGTAWGDPDGDEPSWEVPQATIELAHELAVDWGLDGIPGSPDREAYADLLRPPAAPVSVADEMYQSMGYGAPPQPGPEPSYPGISELRRALGV